MTKPADKKTEPAGIRLPTAPVPASAVSPETMVIFSKPKVGKTTAFTGLKDWLILDLQNGTKYLDALKVNASSVADIKQIGQAIHAAGKPYKGVIIDTATDLQHMCVDYAEKLYSDSPMGKNWFAEGGGKAKYGSILQMPDGNGYPWLYDAFERVVAYIQSWSPRLIISGHVKDTMLDKNGTTFSSLELDLTGRLKRMLTSDFDAVGYLYRKGNKNILSFHTTDGGLRLQARPPQEPGAGALRARRAGPAGHPLGPGLPGLGPRPAFTCYTLHT
jgi:hypothetical protein